MWVNNLVGDERLTTESTFLNALGYIIFRDTPSTSLAKEHYLYGIAGVGVSKTGYAFHFSSPSSKFGGIGGRELGVFPCSLSFLASR